MRHSTCREIRPFLSNCDRSPVKPPTRATRHRPTIHRSVRVHGGASRLPCGLESVRSSRLLTIALTAVLATLALFGCGSRGGASCVAGSQAMCTTTEGSLGVQLCLAAGNYGPCSSRHPAEARPPALTQLPTQGVPPRPTTRAPATAAPAALAWAPLRERWTRLYLDPGCDEEHYRPMTVAPELVWAPQPGTRVTLAVQQLTTYEGDPNGIAGASGVQQTRTATLLALWSGVAHPRPQLSYTMGPEAPALRSSLRSSTSAFASTTESSSAWRSCLSPLG